MSLGITGDERQVVVDCPYSQQAIGHGNSGILLRWRDGPAVGDLLIDIQYPTSTQAG
jgi:hypothetical protein